MNVNSHIEITSGVAGGIPRISGRRFTVQDVVIWHERLCKSADEIADEFDLSLAEVYAALSYYFDNRAEIDRSIREGEDIAEALRKHTPSRLMRKLTDRSVDG